MVESGRFEISLYRLPGYQKLLFATIPLSVIFAALRSLSTSVRRNGSLIVLRKLAPKK